MAAYEGGQRDEPSALVLGLIETGKARPRRCRRPGLRGPSLAGLGGALRHDTRPRPFGKLLSWGWWVEHFLAFWKDWLNEMTGNPGEVRAFFPDVVSDWGQPDENWPSRPRRQRHDGVPRA